MGKLDGQVALISGGARGQGEQQARLFAREGAAIAIGDVLEEDGNRVAESINDTGGQAMFRKLDVSDQSSWAEMVDATTEQFGKLNILINNAGILRNGSIEDTTVQEYLEVVKINQVGVWLGIRAAIKAMKRGRRRLHHQHVVDGRPGGLPRFERVCLVEVRGYGPDEGCGAGAGAVQHPRQLGSSGTD